MERSRNDIELLAPAGSREALVAAAQGGADAVYFGAGRLNMRARSAAGMSRKDLPELVEAAHRAAMKAYLTLNAVIYDRELDEMRQMVDTAALHGVDAIIATDPSVLQYARDQGMRVHLSTQLNVSNLESLKFYAQFADVVVLARELDLEQVGRITEGIRRQKITGPSGEPVKVEMFVHGALCMAISGKCYLSLHAHNHSANRGDCFQVCRRGYMLTDLDREVGIRVENEYLMSPRDLKTIHFLDRILESGIRVLKIEGRARPAEYVKTVTACYHEALAAWIEGTYSEEKVRRWDARLRKVFNRGFWDGYYLGRKMGEWSTVHGSEATHQKIYVGKGTNYFDRIGVAEVSLEAGELSVGDEILITGPTTGVIETSIRELRVNEKDCITARKGEICSFPVQPVVRRSDRVFKVVPRT